MLRSHLHAPHSELDTPNSLSNTVKSSRLNYRSLVYLFGVILAVSVVIVIINTEETSKSLIQSQSSSTSCTFGSDGPVLFNLRTKMGVNYDAGHWFHMAENFMTQHSILREKGLLTNASQVYYNFDEDGFSDNLNGMTRFMLYLATMDASNRDRKMFFVHIDPSRSSIQKGKSGDVSRIDKSLICGPKHQEVILSSKITPHDRFKPVPTYTPASAFDPISDTASNKDPASDPDKSDRQKAHHSSSSGSSGSSSSSSSSSISSTSSSNCRHVDGDSVCMKIVDTIGGKWPTPQRGHWFPNTGDIPMFRQKIREACPPDRGTLRHPEVKKRKKYKLVIYQRDLSRKLLHQEKSIELLQTLLPHSEDWDVQVLMHSSSRSPCALSHILHNVEVLLTPHGFQSMLLLFLPLPSILFEVFPYKYYKRGYGPFGHEYGILHAGVMSPPTNWHTGLFLSFISTQACMDSKFCRGYARNADVELTSHGVLKLAEVIQEHRHQWDVQPSTPTPPMTHSNISVSDSVPSLSSLPPPPIPYGHHPPSTSHKQRQRDVLYI